LDDSPIAPAASASSSSSHIRAISSAVAVRFHASSPMTNRRIGMWPQNAAKFTGVFTLRSAEALYSLHFSQSQATSLRIGSSGMSSKKLKISMIASCWARSFLTGAIEKPQLPLIEVVTP
jgi:hypothetical protein